MCFASTPKRQSLRPELDPRCGWVDSIGDDFFNGERKNGVEGSRVFFKKQMRNPVEKM